jgi:aldehyde dehydrogenase (NAD+)
MTQSSARYGIIFQEGAMAYDREQIQNTVKAQREFFLSGKTLDVSWRREQLKKLKAAVLRFEPQLIEALKADLERSEAEGYFCDVGSTVLEINEAIAGVRRWARPENHFSGFTCFPSVITKVYKMPYGVSLIISPFNFPVLLALGPLAASIAGGNTAVIKASSKSPACTKVLRDLIADTFPPEYCTLIDGGHDVADICLEQRFDKIFYTGSPAVGRHVMEMASRNLAPVTLELGGETGNWAVIRKDADLKDAARKIAFFKLLNSGQICINVNQAAVAEEVADRFVEELKKEFVRQIGENALANPEYPRLISQKAYDKCAAEAEQYRDRVVFGGKGDSKALKYQPTIVYPVDKDEDIVKHELFSPLLPVVTYKDAEVDGLLRTIAEREHGLALYLFTKDKSWAKKVMSTQQYGGGCVNEVCLHLMVKGVPFGGTGHSGIGTYHGEWGFREFTHPSTVLFGKTRFNLPLREHPYTGEKSKFKMKLLKLFEK